MLRLALWVVTTWCVWAMVWVWCPGLLARCTAECCSVDYRAPSSEDVTLCALRTKTLEQLFTPATRLMWSGPVWIIDSEILLLWAVNAKLCRTTNEVVRIVNCQNMIWARERRHEQPVTRITRRGKLRSENKKFLRGSSQLTSCDKWVKSWGTMQTWCGSDSWGPVKD